MSRFTRATLVVASLLLSSSALAKKPKAPQKPPAVPSYVAGVVDGWQESFGIHVTVVAERCGYDNAWYSLATQEITLCAELFSRPALTRWILNHELGHALNDQMHIPWVNPEDGADELAMLMATEDESYAAAAWFLASGGTESDDEHSSDLDRAGAILCYLDGTSPAPVSRECRIYARSVLANWLRLVLPPEA